MKLLHQIVQDLRQGENIDLYVTLLVAIVLTFLNVLGIAPQSWLIPLTLAVLGLLTVTILGNRQRLDALLEKMPQQSQNSLLIDEFPADMPERIQNSSELWMLGISLSNTLIKFYQVFEKQLKRGGRIKVLLIDPEGTSCGMSASALYPSATVDQNRMLINRSLELLYELEKSTQGKLEIRVIDYALSFGGVLVNPSLADGTMYLRLYTFQTPMPKMLLHSQDRRWWGIFTEQYQRLWEKAQVWECA